MNKVHETLAFLLVTLRNIYRLKKFTDWLSNKPFLTWLLTTPPHLQYVAALPCNLSYWLALLTLLFHTYVATYARCGVILSIHLTTSLLRSLPVIFFKSVKIWQNYGHESVAPLFGPPCRLQTDTRWSQYYSIHLYWFEHFYFISDTASLV